ncbi:MAG: hypothetical protein VYC34_08870 [Planctomycetota bacterium]|nr:hypothetical protein [Planctomycetota bacterium]
MMRAPTAADLAVDAALWRPQRKMDVATFSPARAAAHCAAQAASEIGRQLARPKPDDSHTALQWLDDWEALVGVAVGADRPYRAALRTVDLMLLLLDPDLNEVASLSLEHRTTDAARTWIV